VQKLELIPVRIVEFIKRKTGCETWVVEMAFVFMVLLPGVLLTIHNPRVAVIGGLFSVAAWMVETLGLFASVLMFGNLSVANRLEEKEERRAKRGEKTEWCYKWLMRFFYGKEIVWSSYFLCKAAWPPLFVSLVLMRYGWWRRTWRKYHPLEEKANAAPIADYTAFASDPLVTLTFEALLNASAIYLAGPTNRAETYTSSRVRAYNDLRSLGYAGAVFAPQTRGGKRKQGGEGDRIVAWEDEAMAAAKVILFICDWAEYGEGAPGTGDTTKVELVDWMHRSPNKVVVYFPPTTRKSAWWRKHLHESTVEVYADWSEAIAATLRKANAS
jgi:hypothetical protein